MVHDPYFREGTAKTAVLLIHGICGSPGHFRDLAPVIPQNFAVYNILLDGHNGSVTEFGRSSMKKWKAQVQEALDTLLARYEQVLIVAHSMGTLFAIQAAMNHPQRIPRLFLLGVPLRPWVRFSTVCTCIRILCGATDPAAMALKNDTGIALTWKFWEYLTWIPRLLELLAECRRVRKLLPRLATPTETFQSQTDELVSARTSRDLEKNPSIQNTVFLDSGHFVYGPRDLPVLQARLTQILSQLP